MSVVYKTNPWTFPELADYPAWPFHDISFWHLGNIIHEIGVKETGFPAGVSYHSENIARIRIRDAFLCSGILMSPAVYNAGPRAWGFFLEHIESLRPSSGKLRIKADVIHWEERVRTIFAERFALGLAGWLLWNSYGVLHIADASPFIAKTINDLSSPYNRLGLQSLKLYGKNGGYKPDLFCLTSLGDCVIAESKGALGPPSKLTGDKKKGKEQVKNVTPSGISVRGNGGRLVFASNFRHENENPSAGKDSCIEVVDPTENEIPFFVEVTPDEIVQHSYCKLFSLCGLTSISQMLLRGKSFKIEDVLSQQPVEINGIKAFPLLHRHDQTLGIEANIARILFRNRSGVANEINEHINELRLSTIHSNETSFMTPNGIVYGEGWD